MNKLVLRILLVLVGFAGLSIPAKAQVQTIDQVVVNVPFQFVAAGKTFPAGEYRISRLHDNGIRVLQLTSVEDRGNTIMLLTQTESIAQNENVKVAFETVGGQHFMSRIDTGYYSYTLSVPSTEPLLAAVPNRGAAASSASGSN